MKGLGLIFIVPLIIALIFGGAYITNFPVTEIEGVKIGFADIINFFFKQSPPNLPEKNASEHEEISGWFSEIEGKEADDAMVFFQKLGNPIKVCIFKEANYCEILKVEESKIVKTSETPQKTIYVSYDLIFELKKTNLTAEKLRQRIIEGVKNGEIRGITLNDIMSFGKD